MTASNARHAWLIPTTTIQLATPIAWLTAATILFLAACGPGSSAARSTPSPAAGVSVGKGDPWIVYQWIAPNSEHITTLYLVRPDGSGLHILLPGFTESLEKPDWSSDGQRIAFLADRGDREDLWIVNADGTGARRLVSCDAPCNEVSDADWSPDGRKILFVQDDLPVGPGSVPTGFEFKVLDLSSNTVGTLLSRHDGMPVEAARWSPDGRQIVFRRARLAASGHEIGAALFVSDLAGGQERQLTTWDTFAADPDWGPDGRIVFNTYGLDDTIHASNLFLINPDGSGLTQLTTFTAGVKVAATPRWTPDGLAILFTQDGCRDASPISECLDQPQWLRQLATIKPDGTGLGLATPTGVQGRGPELRPVP